MILLDTTTKTFQVVLALAATTANSPVVAAYTDLTISTTTPAAASEADVATNGTTPVTLVSAPVSGNTRRIQYISLVNADTAAITVSFQLNNNGTVRNVFVATLQVGESVVYQDSDGWRVYTSAGSLKTVTSSLTAAPSITVGSTIVTSGTTGDVLTVGAGGVLSQSASGVGSALVQLSKQTLSSPTNTVTFSAIPGTYTNLQLVYTAGATGSSSAADMLLEINGDTDANYDVARLYCSAGSFTPAGYSATGQTPSATYVADALVTTANYVTTGTLNFPGYANTSFFKGVNFNSGVNRGGALTSSGWIQWHNTAAINSITLSVDSGDEFLAGSTFTLYGVV